MSEQELFEKLQNCKECRFHDWKVNVWDSSMGYGKFGPHHYGEFKEGKVMVIGQNPSRHRNPFPDNYSMSGHQGDLFREIFGKENIVFTNLIAISTNDNKVLDEDALHGLKHLQEQIDFYKPVMLIGLGYFCRHFLNKLERQPETYLLVHPDYYMTYYRERLSEYIEQIRMLRERYLQIVQPMV